MDATELAKQLELKKGDFFTVVRWLHIDDNSYRGDCLEAVTVDHPFVRAYCHDHEFTITLDLNQVEIMPLSPEFVKSVLDEMEDETP